MVQSGNCLGIHLGHDRGAAVVRDGRLAACVAEERLDRRKHSNSPEYPMRAVGAVLKTLDMSPADLHGACISYTNVSIENVIDELADELRDYLGRPSLNVFGAGHHVCHAVAAYYTSGADSAAVVVADGAGDIVGAEIEAESLFEGNGENLTFIDRRTQSFGMTRTNRRNTFSPNYIHDLDHDKQISLGRKYEQFTYLIGFGHGQSGKTMGLAAYSKPLFQMSPPQVNGFDFSLRFIDGLDHIRQEWLRVGEPWHHFISARKASIASAAQQLLEDYMIALLRSVYSQLGKSTLCVAGGVFLNCKMNHEILRRTPFDRLYVFPAAGDDGQAVGAAYYAHQKLFGNKPPHLLNHMYFGPSHDTAEIERSINRFNLYGRRLDQSWLIERIVKDLIQGDFVAVMRGRSEIGPRALGHRSIFADPRRSGVKDCLNRIKGREEFRPFAPIVTAEDQFTYFDLKQESPFMLFATELKANFHDNLPSIVHADGTSRVQAIAYDQDPFLHALIKAFEVETGYPILLNTSFNLAGDPIVQSPHDAIATYLASDLDSLVLEDFYIKSKERRPLNKSV